MGGKDPFDWLKFTLRKMSYMGNGDLVSFFQRFDADMNGTLEIHEFRIAVDKMCPGVVNKRTMDKICNLLDKDNDGYIDYKEFCRWAALPNRKVEQWQAGKKEREAAAKKIQANIRGRKQRKKYAKRVKERDEASKVIQQQWRKREQRRRYLEGDPSMSKEERQNIELKLTLINVKLKMTAACYIDGQINYRSAFNSFDEDGGGQLSYLEFTETVKSLVSQTGEELSTFEMQSLCEALDHDRSMQIELDEFVAFCQEPNDADYVKLLRKVQGQGGIRKEIMAQAQQPVALTIQTETKEIADPAMAGWDDEDHFNELGANPVMDSWMDGPTSEFTKNPMSLYLGANQATEPSKPTYRDPVVNPSPRQKRVNNSYQAAQASKWETAIDPGTGQKYYYNRASGQSKWAIDVDIPQNWQTAKDPSTNKIYYYNRITGQTSWNPPIQTNMQTVSPSRPEQKKRGKPLLRGRRGQK